MFSFASDWNTHVSKKWVHRKVIIIYTWNRIVPDMAIKENAGYIKSIRYTKQWQQWIRRNVAVLVFDAFEVISFPGPLSHPRQPAATSCPLSPSLVPPCQEEQAIDMSSVCPLRNSTALFTSRSRGNACSRRSGALPSPVYKNSLLSTCFGLDPL